MTELEQQILDLQKTDRDDTKLLAEVTVTTRHIYRHLFGNGGEGVCAKREGEISNIRSILNKVVGGLIVLQVLGWVAVVIYAAI